MVVAEHVSGIPSQAVIEQADLLQEREALIEDPGAEPAHLQVRCGWVSGLRRRDCLALARQPVQRAGLGRLVG